jgi:hypothetical protein
VHINEEAVVMVGGKEIIMSLLSGAWDLHCWAILNKHSGRVEENIIK